MWNAGTGVVVSIFAIMLVGYLAGHWKLLPATTSEVLSRFVFSISLPALAFGHLSRTAVAEFFNWSFLGTLGGGMFLVFVLSCAVSRLVFTGTQTAMVLHGLTAMHSSTAYIGLPLVLTVFGEGALAPGIIGAVITGAVFTPLAIVLIELDRERLGEKNLWTPLVAVITRPPILAVVGGLVVSASGLVPPNPLVRFCELLGGAFVPCALFAAGFFVAGCRVRGASLEIGWLVSVKLLLHPLITWGLAYYVFELPKVLLAIAVVQAALPSGVPVFVLAQQYKTFMLRSSAAIALSTTLSVLTLGLLLAFLAR